MRFAGIDYGLNRTGLAISDPSERLVFPLATFKLDDFKKRSLMLDALASKILEAKAQACVVGLPIPLSGVETLICTQIRNVTKRLQRRIPLPFYFMNEMLSSEEAWADLRDSGLKIAKRHKVLDQQAAVRILESFLALTKRPDPIA